MAEALTRRYDLDALRVLAVLVLLAYHSSRPFDSEAWHVKSAQLSRMLELLGYVFTPWRLSLLFLISGAGTFFALRTRTARVYLGDRMQRLLLPLAVGMLVVVPPQVYVERAHPWMPNRQSPMNFDGSFLAFLPHVFDGAYPKGNFSWHHLWFLVYLFVFSVVALPLFTALKRERGRAAADRVAGFFARGARIFLLALPLIAIHLALRGRFPSTNALVGDWWNLAHYFTLFLLGYVLLPDARVSAAFERHRRLALGGAIVATILRLALIVAAGPATPYSLHYVVVYTLRGLTEWLALVGVLGYARRYLDRPWGWLRWAGDRVPPFYIWHQTIVVLLAVWIIRWPTGVEAQFATIAVAALIVTVFVCELVGRTNLTRVAFGMRPRHGSGR